MNKKILAPVFTDNMVLQRDKKIIVFGRHDAHKTITVTFNNETLTTTTDDDGSWKVIFPPMAAAVNLVLTADCEGESVTCHNVALGDVWLAGGQSNMEFDLVRCTDWERVSKNPDNNVRFFYTPKQPYRNDLYYQEFDQAKWQLSTDEEFKTWSAVGYLFAEQLSKKLGVTIGIIGCNWGGTSASAWMDRESILSCEDTRIYIDEFDEHNAGISLEKQREDYDAYIIHEQKWNEMCNKCYADNPNISWDEVQEICGTCTWPGPINSFNPFRPCGLYEQMLLEICPYTLKGFIFYQGESDDHRPYAYHNLFTNMVKQWRNVWNEELAFLMVQLPMHKYSGDPDFKNWPVIREAQMKVFKELDNMGIAVIADCGQFNEIHPVDKSQVGIRLALQALYGVYHLISEDEAFGPIYSHKKIVQNEIQLFFEHAKDGFIIKNDIESCEVAGSDKIFHPATVRIEKDRIIFSSNQVENPVYARYCWSNYCTPSIFGTNGIPLAPFRTDEDDELESITGSAKIQQNMET